MIWIRCRDQLLAAPFARANEYRSAGGVSCSRSGRSSVPSRTAFPNDDRETTELALEYALRSAWDYYYATPRNHHRASPDVSIPFEAWPASAHRIGDESALLIRSIGPVATLRLRRALSKRAMAPMRDQANARQRIPHGLARLKNGAANRTRTCDPVITNDVLYQLSYCGGPNRRSGATRNART
jgi:hypothetical protein